MRKKVTIQEIANNLNLSRNTVSKALNGGNVPPETLKRVLERAKALDYKSLGKVSNKRTYNFLIVAGQPLRAIRCFDPIIQTIELYCHDLGYGLQQTIYLDDPKYCESLTKYVTEYAVDGIICFEILRDYNIEKLLKLNVPMCFIDFSMKCLKDGNYDVLVPSMNELRNYLTELIRKGDKKKITYIGDSRHCLSFKEKYDQVISVAFNEGIVHDKDEDCLKRDEIDYGDVFKIRDQLKPLCDEPRILVCANDFLAHTAIRAVKMLQKRIPEDIEIIGFDNSFESQADNITTFALNIAEIAKRCIIQLINRVENSTDTSLIIHVPTTLIQRNSTIKL